MRILAANLKHLYQNSSLLLFAGVLRYVCVRGSLVSHA